MAGATVDIWHCDAGGVYSGFVAASTGGPGGGGGPTDKRTFLRGIQPTNAQGIATFQTIYPGWYRGRAVHIHVKVHLGGNVVHTGQFFFSDALTDTVYKRSPYSDAAESRHAQRRRLDLQERGQQVGARSTEERVRLRRQGDNGRPPLVAPVTRDGETHLPLFGVLPARDLNSRIGRSIPTEEDTWCVLLQRRFDVSRKFGKRKMTGLVAFAIAAVLGVSAYAFTRLEHPPGEPEVQAPAPLPSRVTR